MAEYNKNILNCMDVDVFFIHSRIERHPASFYTLNTVASSKNGCVSEVGQCRALHL